MHAYRRRYTRQCDSEHLRKRHRTNIYGLWNIVARAQITVETCLCRTGYGGKENSGPERGFFTTRIILLLPLLWLVFQVFKGFTSQAIFLLLAFMTLSGWPPPILDLFYGVALTIADWPLSYYNFSQRLPKVYDFATIGFICLLVIYLSHCRIKRWWEIVGMVLVGQFFLK